jgi:hypothetical protein
VISQAAYLSKSKFGALISRTRIGEIGGLEDAAVRRIIDSFVCELPDYLDLITQKLKADSDAELLLILHKLSGASRTCGFSGISQVVDAWKSSPVLLSPAFRMSLSKVIEASHAEWRALVS